MIAVQYVTGYVIACWDKGGWVITGIFIQSVRPTVDSFGTGMPNILWELITYVDWYRQRNKSVVLFRIDQEIVNRLKKVEKSLVNLKANLYTSENAVVIST